MPEVIEWNQTHLGFNGALMERPGIEVMQRDVVEVIRKARAQYDCIIVDVDNGPTAIVLPTNVSLYSNTGLKRVWGALKPEAVSFFGLRKKTQLYHAAQASGLCSAGSPR